MWSWDELELLMDPSVCKNNLQSQISDFSPNDCCLLLCTSHWVRLQVGNSLFEKFYWFLSKNYTFSSIQSRMGQQNWSHPIQYKSIPCTGLAVSIPLLPITDHGPNHWRHFSDSFQKFLPITDATTTKAGPYGNDLVCSQRSSWWYRYTQCHVML